VQAFALAASAAVLLAPVASNAMQRHARLHASTAKHMLMPKAKPAEFDTGPEAQAAAYRHEQAMTHVQLIERWDSLIQTAAKRFDIPDGWIREVMRMESGGRTMLTATSRMISSQGALGLMQVQAKTYGDMRAQFGLGGDPFNPHDNIMAGAAYLKWLQGKYGYPAMFAAYDDGPGNLEQRTATGTMLPDETRNYVTSVTLALGDPGPDAAKQAALNAALAVDVSATSSQNLAVDRFTCFFTKPDGTPVTLDCRQVTSARMPTLQDPSSVNCVITANGQDMRVREDERDVMRIVLSHGGQIGT
jgi:hypothetical protein